MVVDCGVVDWLVDAGLICNVIGFDANNPKHSEPEVVVELMTY